MGAGRPTEYYTALCEKVKSWGREGKSLAWMAANIGVSRECIYEWTRVHPEFSDAMKLAKLFAQAWWEDLGQANIVGAPGSTLNASVYSRSMSARFPDDWRENKGVELTGANGGPVEFKKIERAIIDPKD